MLKRNKTNRGLGVGGGMKMWSGSKAEAFVGEFETAPSFLLVTGTKFLIQCFLCVKASSG